MRKWTKHAVHFVEPELNQKLAQRSAQANFQDVVHFSDYSMAPQNEPH